MTVRVRNAPLARASHDGSRPAPRSPLDVVAQQLTAIERFHGYRHLAEEAAAAAARSRELRMDAARRLEVVRREHEALVARADEQLRRTGDLLHGSAAPRVVLAHRNAWFAGRVAELLRDAGAQVVASVDNGADAIGVAVAEQPDLMLVEDALPMATGAQVVQQVLRFSPDTRVAAQVAYSDGMSPLLDAGAASVFVRSVPPADVAAALLELLEQEQARPAT